MKAPFKIAPYTEYDEFTLDSRWGQVTIRIHEPFNDTSLAEIIDSKSTDFLYLELDKNENTN